MKNKKMKFFAIIFIFFYIIIALHITSFAGTLSSDINGIDESKYPGVKSLIQNLQKKHSNYKFQVFYTGIDWTEAVTMEYQGHGSSPKNLFSASAKYKGKWYCPICGSKTYDTGWYCASKEAIEYMMDPRNSLDETSVFQFKNLEVADVSAENVQTVINNKYSSYSYINNPTAINAMVRASSDYNLNGYSILAKIVNEQGSGTSPLATGSGYEGEYVGYYNFFNVGAYGNGKSTVIRNGLKYAKNKDWNSVEKSILGGSEYYKSQYIGRGQNTLYYQRFNVVYTNSLFSHQYQQDIMGAQTSGTLLKNYYTISSTISSVEQSFIIPLYDNMPSIACSRPSTTENNTVNYEKAKVLTNKLPVRANPNGNRVISYLNDGETVRVIQRATKVSNDGNYWDIIVTDTDGTYGYVLRLGISHAIQLPKYIFDAKYYADSNPDIKSALGYDEYKLLEHFTDFGIKEGRASSPTFNVRYYLEANDDLKKAFGNNYTKAFEHFKNFGCKECRMSSEGFDGMFYKYYYSDLTNLSSVQLMEHYLNFGMKEGRIGGLEKTMENIVFDSEFYSSYYTDVNKAFGSNYNNLKKHWLQFGIGEGRQASIIYNPEMYKLLNDDLQKAFGNNKKVLFEHFIKFGIKEGRCGSLLFNVNQYLIYNNDIKTAFGNNYKSAMSHFCNFGIKEGRSASVLFEVINYLESNPDLKKVFGNNYKLAYIHFMQFGINERRKTSSRFDINFYIGTYNDLQQAFKTDYKQYFIHYLKYGIKEGRRGI